MATHFWTSGHTTTGWASSSSPTCCYNTEPKTLEDIITELEWQMKEDEYYSQRVEIDKSIYLKLKT